MYISLLHCEFVFCTLLGVTYLILSEQVVVTVNHVPQGVQRVTCLVKGDQGYTSDRVPASTNRTAEGLWMITCSALVSAPQLQSPSCECKYM